MILLFHTVSIPPRRRPCAALNFACTTNPSLIVCRAGCAASGRGSEQRPGPPLVPALAFCIDEHPNSPMVEQAEKARTAFVHRRLKASAVGGFRHDVMMYISQALQTFTKLGPQKRQEIGLEIAILGRNGLDINDRTASTR